MKKDASLEAGATRATAKIKSESRSLVAALARDDKWGDVGLPTSPDMSDCRFVRPSKRH
jgi:hypothetical protein